MDDTPSLSSKLAPAAVRVVALWILTGALYKLFAGSPNDLPPVVRDFFLGPTLTFRLAIAIEISIALPALFQPRAFWPLVVAQMVVFLGILIQLVVSGAESCGCFGSSITIPPAVMMGIDGVGLLAILLTRPWSTLPFERPKLAYFGPILLLAWASPWMLISTEAVVVESEDGTATALPRFVDWEPTQWIGKHVRDTGLADVMDVDSYNQDGDWILYSVTCDHCAAYLHQLGQQFAEDPKFYTFVRLSQTNEEELREVDADLMPPGDEAILPAEVQYVITPPWHLRLEQGVVREAFQAEASE